MTAHIQSRLVPDPMMTDAEYLHQRAENPTKPTIGKVWVQENAITRIGGLVFIRRRLSHHERAAEWFKSAYEALYGGLAPAIDMAKIRVDTSIMAHDTGIVARIDRASELIATMQAIGSVPRDRVISCVVLCQPASAFADPGPSGKPSGRAVEREVDALLDALDHVAELQGMKMRGPTSVVA